MDKNNERNDVKPNYFTRFLTIVFFTLVILLITLSFRYSSSDFQISKSIPILLVLLLVASLSEMFDSISVSNLVTLKKEVKSKKNENGVLKADNIVLRSQITSLCSNISQAQNLTNFNIQSLADLSRFVKPATEHELAELKKQLEESNISQLDTNNVDSAALQALVDKSKTDAMSTKMFKNIARKKYLAFNN